MLRTPRRLKGAVILAVCVGVYNVARSLIIPDDAHFACNVAVGVSVAVGAVAIGMDHGVMGFSRASLPSGLRIGGLAFAAIVLVVGIGVSPFSPIVIADDRVDVSFGEMLLRALIVIPVGTVLVEELIFRGVLHWLLRSELAVLPAALVGSVLFGAWHLVPVWSGYADVAVLDAGRIAAVVGTFAATFVAGIGFVWLRERADHLVAPILAHTATNSATFALVWIAAR